MVKAGWKAPEPFRGKAKDGTTDLYALIWKPSNFDAAKKYPIVEMVYTGPQGFLCRKPLPQHCATDSNKSLSWVSLV